MTLIMNTVEFCKNYRPIDQKSIDKLSILSFLSDCGETVSINRGFSMTLIMNTVEFLQELSAD